MHARTQDTTHRRRGKLRTSAHTLSPITAYTDHPPLSSSLTPSLLHTVRRHWPRAEPAHVGLRPAQ